MTFFPKTKKQSDTIFLENFSNNNDKICFQINYEKEVIGLVSLSNIDWANSSAEYGILIGNPDYWGLGIGSATTKLIIDYVFYQIGLNRLSLNVLSTNNRAITLYQKLGFKTEGTLRECVLINGQRYDNLVMSIILKDIS